jgi:hypothetical protein
MGWVLPHCTKGQAGLPLGRIDNPLRVRYKYACWGGLPCGVEESTPVRRAAHPTQQAIVERAKAQKSVREL